MLADRMRHDQYIAEQDGGVEGEAAQWLEKALQAFFAADREEEWRALLGRLIELHRRKHKLRPLLEALL